MTDESGIPSGRRSARFPGTPEPHFARIRGRGTGPGGRTDDAAYDRSHGKPGHWATAGRDAAFDLVIRGGPSSTGPGRRVRARCGRHRRPDRGDRRPVGGRRRGWDVIEAAGRVVAPGFIDVHVHSEIALLTESDDRWAGVRMGVTTNLTGPDGFGFAGLPPEDARSVEQSIRSINGPAPDLAFDWPTPEAYLRAFEVGRPSTSPPRCPTCRSGSRPSGGRRGAPGPTSCGQCSGRCASGWRRSCRPGDGP